MKKKFRIKDSEEFRTIIKTGKYRSSHSFVVYGKTKQDIHGRIGITVPRKLGNAVLRNKTKRQVTNMIRKMKNKQDNMDVIILVRKGYFKNTYLENQKDLENLLKTVKIK